MIIEHGGFRLNKQLICVLKTVTVSYITVKRNFKNLPRIRLLAKVCTSPGRYFTAFIHYTLTAITAITLSITILENCTS
jgi:hypothetical protein